MLRTLSDLRGENFRLQRENNAKNHRVEEMKREFATQSNALLLKIQESEIVDEEIERLQKETEGNING